METINEMVKNMQESLKSHQKFKEGQEVYYLDIEEGRYGDYGDILKVVKTNIINMGFNYDQELEITLEYGNKKIPQKLIDNRLYIDKESLIAAISSYLDGVFYIERGAGTSPKRYGTYLRPYTSYTLAKSKKGFLKKEYLLYLSKGKKAYNYVEIQGVYFKGFDGKYPQFSNNLVEKDLSNLVNYYGEDEIFDLISDIFSMLSSDNTQQDNVINYVNSNGIKEDINIENLLSDNSFVKGLLDNKMVIDCLAEKIIDRNENSQALNRLAKCIGLKLISKIENNY